MCCTNMWQKTSVHSYMALHVGTVCVAILLLLLLLLFKPACRVLVALARPCCCPQHEPALRQERDVVVRQNTLSLKRLEAEKGLYVTDVSGLGG